MDMLLDNDNPFECKVSCNKQRGGLGRQDESIISDLPDIPEPLNEEKEYQIIERELKKGLEEHDITEPEDLLAGIKDRKDEIADLEKNNKKRQALKRKPSLEDLERLLTLYERMQQITQEEQNLKIAEIMEVLETHDIKTIEALPEEIEERKEELKKLELKGHTRRILERKASLKELEELRSKAEAAEILKPLLKVVQPPVTREDVKLKPKQNSEVPKAEQPDDKAVDELKGLYEDYVTLPKCSERAVMAMLYYASLQKIEGKEASDSGLVIIEHSEEDIDREFLSLEAQLRLEELDMVDHLKLVERSHVLVKNKDWTSTCRTLKQLLKELRPLNILEILRLIERASSAADLVRGQNIILFLGETGVGKSTTIHTLAGSRMIETTINGMNHIGYVEGTNPALNKIKTSPLGKSETRYITCIQINPDDIDGATFDDIIYLCDSPGFGDTAGPEVDIANCAGMVYAIKQCKTVKIVVLISYKSVGDRMTGVKNLAHLLSGMITDMKEHSKAFSYFFTKYPEKEQKAINASLKDVKKQLGEGEELDEGFKILLNKMIQKTSNRPATTINPLQTDAVAVLNDLMDSESIKRPDEVFQFSLTENSKTAIQDQLRKQELAIMKAIDRCDYVLACHKFNELRRLDQTLAQKNINQTYLDCVKATSKKLNSRYDSTISTISRALAEQNELTHEDVVRFSESIKAAEAAEVMRKEYLGAEVVSGDAYIHKLRELIKHVASATEQKEVNDLLVKANLDKISLISSIFSEFSSEYDRSCQIVLKKIDSSAELFSKLVSNDELEKAAEEIQKIFQCVTSLTGHIDQSTTQQKYEEAKSCLLDVVEASIERVNPVFEQQTLNEENVEVLKACLSRIRAIQETPSLHPHVRLEDIKTAYDSPVQKIVTHFDNINKEISAQFTTHRESSLSGIEALIKEMTLIRTIPDVDYKTTQSYHSTLEMLFGFVTDLGRDVEQILASIADNKDNINYQKLFRCLNGLKMAKWLEKLRPAVYANLINDVDEKVMEHLLQLDSSVKGASFSLEDFDNLNIAYKKLCQINMTKDLQKIIPGVTDIVNEANSLFNERAQCEFKIIKDAIEKWPQNDFRSFEFRKADGMLKYLQECKGVDPLSRQASDLLSELSEVIKSYGKSAERQRDECYGMVLSSDSKTRADLFTNAQKLANHLRELYLLKDSFPEVFKTLDPDQKLIAELKRKFREDSSDLSENMNQYSVAKQNQLLNDKILIVKALSQLDAILGERLFTDIYQQYQNQFNKDVPNVLKEGTQAIENYNYSYVFDKILELEALANGKQMLAGTQASQLKKVLNDSIEQLATEAMNATRIALLKENISIESLLLVVEKLKHIQNAKTHVSKYLINLQKIDDQVLSIREILSNGVLDLLKGVEGVINSNNFAEVDKKKQTVRIFLEILGNYLDQKVFDTVNRLEELKIKKLEALSIMFSNTKITEYFIKPPNDICGKLAKVKDASSEYEETLSKIEESIVTELRKELVLARSEQLTETANPHIRNFESALNYLPEHLKSVLNQELIYCKEDIKNNETYHISEIASTIETQDPEKMKDAIKKYPKGTSSRNIATSALKQIQEHKSQVDTLIETGEISKASASLRKMFEYKKHLGDVVSEINHPYSETRSRLLNRFKEINTSILSMLSNLSATILADATVEIMKKNFDTLLEFVVLAEATKEHEVSKDIFKEDFASKLQQIDEKFSTYFQHYQKRYEDALQTMDAPTLVAVINLMKKWDSFFNHTKDCTSPAVNSNQSINSILSTLSQVKQCSEMTKTISTKIVSTADDVMNIQLLNPETEDGEKQRNKFYESLNSQLSTIMNATELASYLVDVNIQEIQKKCTVKVEEQLKAISTQSLDILDKVQLLRGDADRFNMLYANIITFSKLVKGVSLPAIKEVPVIDAKVNTKIQDLARKAVGTSDIQDITDCLLNMKTWSDYLFDFKPKIDQKIDEVLLYQRNKKDGGRLLDRVGTLLNQDETGIGSLIVSEHKCFKGYSVSLFNSNVNKHGLDHVLKHLDGDEIDKVLLKKRYEEYESCYKKLVKLYLKPKLDLKPLISEIHLAAGNAKQTQDQIVWDAEIRCRIPKLIAHIFALWTLMNSTHYFEAEGLSNKDSYLLQPHAAQVISIFRMLGVGDTKEVLKNNLVQIGTGEGKSVTLAVTASVLTLLGFDVDCACYSGYLSERDYAAFQSMFDLLNVLNYTQYGTFNKMCEGVINQNGDIRKLVTDTILSGTNTAAKTDQSKRRPKILLIDEVDVFFSKDFYGNLYTPSSSLKDPTISALLDYIWKQRTSLPTLAQVKTTPEFQACCQKFQQWESLIEEAVKDLLFDIKSFESHSYVVNKDKIGYKEQDNITFNVAYGYKTLFAYYTEHEKAKISQESLDNYKGIQIKCGSFSYAEIPHMYKFIMGVTGTLKTLSDPERKVIQDVYGIKRNTYCPSVFGANNLKFSEKDDVSIENSNDYFNAIVREIEARIQGKLEDTKRAVLVFFETDKKLEEFYNSPAAVNIKSRIIRITEEVTGQEKEALIRRASTSGQITLLTCCFGRGTDFICRDQTVLSNGGVHVIQTFLSVEESEEVQIKGRTARQGNSGSYSLVLLETSLEQFLVTKENLEEIRKGPGILLSLFKSNTEYAFLNKKRRDLFKAQYEENGKFLSRIKVQHDEAIKFLKDLHASRLEEVKKFLIAQNKGAGIYSPSKTIVLMDATGSMVNLLHKAKNTVGDTFDRAEQILAEHNIDKDCFQVQFVFFRNYNSPADKLLQVSTWENKPRNLRAYADTISVEGGWVNEAIEVALWHANMENEKEKITQVILIGDAAANTESEVDTKRGLKGENYWKTTSFAQKTNYKIELKRLQDKQIPVHGFFVNKQAEANFREISGSTGRCEELDINSEKGADMLTTLMTEEILRNVGQSNGKGDALVDAYRAKFGKSYQ